MRVIIAGVVGGIVMFIWASLVHGLTPLAAVGVSAMPNEAPALSSLHAMFGDRPGLYVFPSMTGAAASKAPPAMPQGIIVYNPPGGPSGVTPRRLIVEFGLELIESILTAVVIGGLVARGFAGRLGVAAAIGAVAAIATNFSYWNWYGFGLDYTFANAFVELMKFVLAGAAIALILPRRTTAPA